MARNKEVYASYKPLYETLKKKNMTISDLVAHGIIRETIITRMNNGFDLPSTIEELCNYLKCSKEEVVEYLPVPGKEE
jgi:DNA-binding Xre family transcriptional regulator